MSVIDGAKKLLSQTEDFIKGNPELLGLDLRRAAENVRKYLTQIEQGEFKYDEDFIRTVCEDLRNELDRHKRPMAYLSSDGSRSRTFSSEQQRALKQIARQFKK